MRLSYGRIYETAIDSCTTIKVINPAIKYAKNSLILSSSDKPESTTGGACPGHRPGSRNLCVSMGSWIPAHRSASAGMTNAKNDVFRFLQIHWT